MTQPLAGQSAWQRRAPGGREATGRAGGNDPGGEVPLRVGPPSIPQSSSSRAAGDLRTSATGHGGNWRLSDPLAPRFPAPGGQAGPGTAGAVGRQPPPGSGGRKERQTPLPERWLTDAVEGESLEVRPADEWYCRQRTKESQWFSWACQPSSESKAGNLRCQAFLPPWGAAIPARLLGPAPAAGFRRPARPNSLTGIPQPVD